MQKARWLSALLAIAVTFIALDRQLAAEELKAIEVPGDRAFTESVTAGPDGTMYLSSPASGGIARIKPGASKAEAWIAPGAFESRSTFGVFADAKSNTLWVCSNDVSSRGVAGPSSVTGSHLKGFDLATGKELPNWHPSMLPSFRPIVGKQNFRVTRYEGHRPIPMAVFKSGVW